MKKTVKKFLLLVLLLCCPQAVQAHSYKAGMINVGHPWTMPTASGVAEVYMGLMNMGEKADQLVGASTSIARNVELQELRPDKQGTDKVSVLDLPVKRGVSLRPSGHHIRLEGLRGPLTAGDKFTLRLQFAEAPATDVTVFVENHGAQHN